MALRSQIGSSLVAKSNPASPLRKSEEQRAEKPELIAKGQIGSVNRKFVEEPFLKPTPAGSARTVSVTPVVESVANPVNSIPSENIAPGMGMMTTPGVSGTSANEQPLFQGGVSPASRAAPTTRGGVAASGVSRAGTVQAPINPGGEYRGAVSTSQAQSPKDYVGSFYPGAAALGGRVAADDPNGGGEIAKNFGQAFWGTVGNAVKSVAPGFNAKAQAYATNPEITKSGVGSLTQPVKNIQAVAQAPRVQNAVNALRSILQAPSKAGTKIGNKLRSLFGR